MAFTTREYTNKILELMDEGCIDPKPEEEEEEDDPMDDYNYVGSPHHY